MVEALEEEVSREELLAFRKELNGALREQGRSEKATLPHIRERITGFSERFGLPRKNAFELMRRAYL